jgi:hypothetical protein
MGLWLGKLTLGNLRHGGKLQLFNLLPVLRWYRLLSWTRVSRNVEPNEPIEQTRDRNDST